MTISNYYDLVQREILLKRKQIGEFISTPKLLGDYYEELISDYLKTHLPSQFKVLRGVVADPPKERVSKECDIIIYDSTSWFPLFKTGNMGIVPSYCVKFVIEVKSQITTDTLTKAKKTFQSVHEIESAINCFLLGFESARNLQSLRNELENNEEVFVLSDRNGESIPGQFRALMDKLEHPGIPTERLRDKY